jgi:hypothetical protein
MLGPSLWPAGRGVMTTRHAAGWSCTACAAEDNKTVMGPRTNGRVLNLLGWATTAVMGLAAIALVVTTLVG